MKLKTFEQHNHGGSNIKSVGYIIQCGDDRKLLAILTAFQEHVVWGFIPFYGTVFKPQSDNRSDLDQSKDCISFNNDELIIVLNKFINNEEFRNDVIEFYSFEYDEDMTMETVKEVLEQMKEFKGDIIVRP